MHHNRRHKIALLIRTCTHDAVSPPFVTTPLVTPRPPYTSFSPPLTTHPTPTPSCLFFFFFNDPAPPEISSFPLPAALPIPRAATGARRGERADADDRCRAGDAGAQATRAGLPPPPRDGPPAAGDGESGRRPAGRSDRKSTRLNSSHLVISYAVFCLEKKKRK